jgi:hypothetical protein
MKCIVVASGLMLGMLPTAGFAHGVHATNGEDAPAVDLSWLSLINPAEAAMTIRIDKIGGYRLITADGLPDHDTGAFPNRHNPNRIARQNYQFRVPLIPEKSGRIVPLRRSMAFGVAINGVPFDPSTAENWNNDPRSGWSVEALGGAMDLGLDRNNAHVQPNGAYHYHAIPIGIMEHFAQAKSPILLGYAADGFPIYGPYGYRDAGDMQSPLVEQRASYRVKSGTRPNGPRGAYNGFYTEDWEYVAGLGTLDECNGRNGTTAEYPNGTYHYVITAAFPLIPRCFLGTPDPGFNKEPPGGPGGPGGPPGRRPGPPPGGPGFPPPR